MTWTNKRNTAPLLMKSVLPVRISRALLALALAAGFWPCGCSKHAAPDAVLAASAFDSAPAPVQQMWKDALACAKNGQYPRAVTNLIALRQQSQLSAEQQAAFDRAWDWVGNEAFKAANKGDSQALKAVQQMRETRGR
jgi:hypothetical protein